MAGTYKYYGGLSIGNGICQTSAYNVYEAFYNAKPMDKIHVAMKILDSKSIRILIKS